MESPGPAAPCETILNSLAKKLGSDLGPIAAENRVIGAKTTQNQLKRDNNLAFLPLLRDQGVGGSNPLSPTILQFLLA